MTFKSLVLESDLFKKVGSDLEDMFFNDDKGYFIDVLVDSNNKNIHYFLINTLNKYKDEMNIY